ncbi:TPA: acylneuraminate cytidylyltransferase, partial [Escherichia coli]
MDKESSLDIDDRMDFELAITIQQKKNRQKILYQNIHNRINEKRNEFDSVSDITLIGHSLFDYWDVKKINDIEVNNLGIAGINSKEYYEYIIEKELIVNFGEFVFIF